MGRVFYGLRRAQELYNFFEDNNKFSESIPYVIRVKQSFLSDDIAPLHCAENIEIMYLKDTKGAITINSKTYGLEGEQVFVIPPNVIHSTSIYKCDGMQIIIQISLHDIKKYINLDAIAEYDGIRISDIAYSIPNCQFVHEIFNQLIDHDTDFCYCISQIALLFSHLFRYIENRAEQNDMAYEKNKNNNELLRTVLNWTKENYTYDIDIETVAGLVGYTRYYFCNWFKSMTGITYMTHLSNVRNANACLLLKSGHSVTESGLMCGFGNISYFTQQFKKKYGMTPRQYVAEFEEIAKKQGEAIG